MALDFKLNPCKTSTAVLTSSWTQYITQAWKSNFLLKRRGSISIRTAFHRVYPSFFLSCDIGRDLVLPLFWKLANFTSGSRTSKSWVTSEFIPWPPSTRQHRTWIYEPEIILLFRGREVTREHIVMIVLYFFKCTLFSALNFKLDLFL